MAGEQLLPWIDSGDAEGNRNSMQNFEGDGIITSWDFNFAGGYISTADVKAYIYRTASGLTEAIDPIVLTGPNTIQVIPAVPDGDFLVVYRDTPKDMPLVNYSTGAVLDEANLDKSNNQAIFVAAEMSDRFDAINSSSADAIERSFEALTTAQAADAKSDTALAASTDAVNTANAANTTAQEAKDIAEDAVAASVGFQTNLEFYTGDDVTSRGADWQTGSVASPGNQRWFAGTDTASDFTIDRYNDAGVLQGSAVKVDRQTGEVTLEAQLDMTASKIVNVADGTAAQDAVTKAQLDAVATAAAADFNSQKIDKDGTLDFAAHQKLFNSTPTDPLHAASKGYVDATLAIGLPSGMVAPFAFTGDIAGWIVCDGREVSRTTFSALFAAIGTFYGAGNGTTTFNVPNYSGYFLRGLGGSSAGLGAEQLSQNLAHSHGVNDSGHGHGINDPGHSHPVPVQGTDNTDGFNAYRLVANVGSNITTSAATTGVTVQAGLSNVSIQSSGGTEARPVNKAVVYRIKT